MNSTSEQFDGEQPDQQESTAGPYAYSIGIFLAVIIFLMVITYTYYHIYARNNRNPAAGGGGAGGNSINSPRISTTEYDHERPHHDSVLDEAAIHAYPKLLYSKVKDFKGDSTSTGNAAGCSICLQDYKDVDVLRILSECGHFFHQKCVDPWLRIHPTCPICRNFPTPITSHTSTPAVISEGEIFV